MDSRVKIITGHYGCGKTNLTLNLARDAAARGEKVTLVDLDIVNPYFRTTDYASEMEALGITVISPTLAGTTLDSPSLSAGIFSVFDGDGSVFFDVGGDDVGAGALGRFSRRVHEIDSYEMIYVINCFRPVTAEPEGAVSVMREIEASSGIRATALINNSHLCSYTSAEDVLRGFEYAEKTAALSGLPLLCTTVPEALMPAVSGKVHNPYPVDVIVKLPFDAQ